MTRKSLLLATVSLLAPKVRSQALWTRELPLRDWPRGRFTDSTRTWLSKLTPRPALECLGLSWVSDRGSVSKDMAIL